MAADNPFRGEDLLIRSGATCLLNACGRRFQVRVLRISENAIYTSFPVKDFVVAGMFIDLEFHQDDGYLECRAQVIEGPTKRGGEVILRRPIQSRWNLHRDSNRVATDLTVHVRDQAHPRSYDAGLLNLSSGGMLIRSKAPLSIPATVEVTLSLPGEPQHIVTGRVVHMDCPPGCPESEQRFFGIHFIDLSSDAYESIIHYITQRLAED